MIHFNNKVHSAMFFVSFPRHPRLCRVNSPEFRHNANQQCYEHKDKRNDI